MGTELEKRTAALLLAIAVCSVHLRGASSIILSDIPLCKREDPVETTKGKLLGEQSICKVALSGVGTIVANNNDDSGARVFSLLFPTTYL